MKKTNQKKPNANAQIAKEHIRVLFKEAEKRYKEDPKLSNKYVKLARKIAMKFKVKLTSVQKRKFCKHCYIFLMPGSNARVRTKDGNIVYYCLSCKKHSRIPLA